MLMEAFQVLNMFMYSRMLGPLKDFYDDFKAELFIVVFYCGSYT